MQYILINAHSCGHFGHFKGVGGGGDVQGVVGGVAFCTNLKLPGDQRRALNRESIK